MSRYCDHEIEKALRSVATLIAKGGDVYWPIFEKLEDALNRRRTRSAQLASWLGERNVGSPAGQLQAQVNLPVPTLKPVSPRDDGRSGL